MQNRYAGDVGDFVKLGLLRHLASPPAGGGVGLRPGLNWYLSPDEDHNADGKHVAYLDPSNRWHQSLNACDPQLMARLADVVSDGRSVAALEASGVLPEGTRTHSEMIDPALGPKGRREWHRRALDALAGAECVFADPDNGIRTYLDGPQAHKYAAVQELADYATRGQSLIVYQHAGRSLKATDQAEEGLNALSIAVGQLPVHALIARRGSCRFFFVTAADENHFANLVIALQAFAAHWAPHVELI